MTSKDCSMVIKNYVRGDKSGTAVLLSGEWGSGKTYYVKNVLKDYLIQNCIKSVYVSLYGFTSVSEVYKNIYVELRLSVIEGKKGEKVTTGRAIAKGIITGVMGFAKFDFQISDDDLEKIYESVSLDNTLVILDDLERCELDICTILGVVNDLVENNNAKVLLVANEKALFGGNDSFLDALNKSAAKTPEEEKYIKAKEKTIGTTLYMSQDLTGSVFEIVLKYGSDVLRRYITEDYLNDVVSLIKIHYAHNLRTFQLALQKTEDVLNQYDEIAKKYEIDIDIDFYYFTIRGILYFIPKYRTLCGPVRWMESSFLSREWGNEKNPLPKAAFEYIVNNTISKEDLTKSYEAFNNYMFFKDDSVLKDDNFKILDEWYKHTDEDVLSALANIEEMLKKPNEIGLSAYNRLVHYMTNLANVVGYNSENAKKLLINNVKGLAVNTAFEPDKYFDQFDYEYDERTKKEYMDLMNAIKVSMCEGAVGDKFTYSPVEIDKLMQDEYNYHRSGEPRMFISCYSIEKIVDMLKKSSSDQIQKFREVMFYYYRTAGPGEFDEDDVVALEKLKENLENELDDGNTWDNIGKKLIEFQCNNIYKFINQMSD